MSGFDIDWLSLRRPADRAARAAVLVGLIARDLGDRDSVTITDLGAGSGATRNALGPLIPADQTWRLCEIDPVLLASAAAAEETGRAIPVEIDLSRDIDAALDAPTDIVTTSAFLDLTSAAWIDRLVAALASRKLPFYAALSYDGRVEYEPAHPLDETVTTLVNLHQTNDKGFGPALGPEAHVYAAERLRSAGFDVVTGTSDWVLGPAEGALQRAYVAGHAEAVAETGQLAPDALAGWRAFRFEAIEAGTSTILVGHGDLYAVPEGTLAATNESG